ncbi:hypothetical protein BSLA_01f3911 [Burkholderia stabilis]|nr:hypothetical protein BSLA_01f3911 [Burkholderia stabilis]
MRGQSGKDGFKRRRPWRDARRHGFGNDRLYGIGAGFRAKRRQSGSAIRPARLGHPRGRFALRCSACQSALPSNGGQP